MTWRDFVISIKPSARHSPIILVTGDAALTGKCLSATFTLWYCGIDWLRKVSPASYTDVCVDILRGTFTLSTEQKINDYIRNEIAAMHKAL